MKSATAYKKGETLYLHSSSKTTVGVWVASPPFLSVESERLQAKGEAVLAVLNASRENVPHPTNWDNVSKPLFDLTGVKSWSTFIKHAKCVGLEAESGQLKFIPQRKVGRTESFQDIPELAIEVSSNASLVQIAEALETAFARCQ